MLLIQWLWVIETKSVNKCCTNIMKCCEKIVARCEERENREIARRSRSRYRETGWIDTDISTII